MLPRTILLLVLAVTAAVYWSGLSGPFIFDDPWNLEPVRLWQAGQASLLEVIFPQPSLLNSRPVSMGSFALTTWLWGADSFSFKLGNLLIHLGCGVLGWVVLRCVLLRDKRLAHHAELVATLAATFWLLHPLQVSTVLYAVQRMAQLSALFTLAAICLYLLARQQLIHGRTLMARVNLFIAFPAMLLLGILSKQNAAVAPAICLALEFAYFREQPRHGRTLPAFFAIFLAVPALGMLSLLLFAPHTLLATYAEWDFGVWERLLTQSRALMDYIGMLLIPRAPLMGLYTDDFTVSQGLLSPPSTLLALLALAAVSVAAIVLRKLAPSVFAGWFFFLIAHGVESSFLPLEMYYEHRNYLPSLGLFLAVLGLISLTPVIQTNFLSPRKLGLLAATGFALALCVATFGRVLVWQDMGTIAQLGLKYHPDSLRARFDVAAWALQRGEYDTALESMHHLSVSDDPRHRQLGDLSIVTVNCMRGTGEHGRKNLKLAADTKLASLTTFEAQAFIRIAGATRQDGCGTLERGVIADHLQQIIDAADSQPETASPKWFSRYALAEIYARDRQWHAAQEEAKLAWEGGRDKKIGVFLAKLYVQNGHLQEATSLVSQLQSIIKPYDKQGQAALVELNALLANERPTVALPDKPSYH